MNSCSAWSAVTIRFSIATRECCFSSAIWASVHLNRNVRSKAKGMGASTFHFPFHPHRRTSLSRLFPPRPIKISPTPSQPPTFPSTPCQVNRSTPCQVNRSIPDEANRSFQNKVNRLFQNKIKHPIPDKVRRSVQDKIKQTCPFLHNGLHPHPALVCSKSRGTKC